MALNKYFSIEYPGQKSVLKNVRTNSTVHMSYLLFILNALVAKISAAERHP
jgi:hypothetical protein